MYISTTTRLCTLQQLGFKVCPPPSPNCPRPHAVACLAWWPDPPPNVVLQMNVKYFPCKRSRPLIDTLVQSKSYGWVSSNVLLTGIDGSIKPRILLQGRGCYCWGGTSPRSVMPIEFVTHEDESSAPVMVLRSCFVIVAFLSLVIMVRLLYVLAGIHLLTFTCSYIYREEGSDPESGELHVQVSWWDGGYHPSRWPETASCALYKAPHCSVRWESDWCWGSTENSCFTGCVLHNRLKLSA